MVGVDSSAPAILLFQEGIDLAGRRAKQCAGFFSWNSEIKVERAIANNPLAQKGSRSLQPRRAQTAGSAGLPGGVGAFGGSFASAWFTPPGEPATTGRACLPASEFGASCRRIVSPSTRGCNKGPSNWRFNVSRKTSHPAGNHLAAVGRMGTRGPGLDDCARGGGRRLLASCP